MRGGGKKWSARKQNSSGRHRALDRHVHDADHQAAAG